jgi:hypothetical protein
MLTSIFSSHTGDELREVSRNGKHVLFSHSARFFYDSSTFLGDIAAIKRILSSSTGLVFSADQDGYIPLICASMEGYK